MSSVSGALGIICHFCCNQRPKLFRLELLLMLAMEGLCVTLSDLCLKEDSTDKERKYVNFLQRFRRVLVCGNLSIVQILPAPEWFKLRMGPRKGGGG